MKLFGKKNSPEILSPLEGYNRWAHTYRNESNPIKNFSDEFVKKSLPALENKSFLDFGCGTGKFCRLAETKNASQVCGIDISPVMIEQAKKETRKTEYICGEISDIPLQTNSFDVIVTSLVMGHLSEIKPTLDKLLDSLKREGSFIITDFHPYLTLTQSKRTFTDLSTRKQFEIRHHLHLFEEYFTIFSEHQVTVDRFEEPMFNGVPVIFGLQAKKN